MGYVSSRRHILSCDTKISIHLYDGGLQNPEVLKQTVPFPTLPPAPHRVVEPPTSPLSQLPALKNRLITPISQRSRELAFFSQTGDSQKTRWGNWLIAAKHFECKYPVAWLYSGFLIFNFPFTNMWHVFELQKMFFKGAYRAVAYQKIWTGWICCASFRLTLCSFYHGISKVQDNKSRCLFSFNSILKTNGMMVFFPSFWWFFFFPFLS